MASGGQSTYSLSAYGRLLRDNRDFRLLWFAQIVSELGDWFYAVAIYSLLLELTGQARSVGLAVVLQLLPQVFMAPMAGVINDRLRRRSVMIFADIARVFIVLAMLLVSSPSMVWLIWILLFTETTMWALFEPGRTALIPSVTGGKDQIVLANALSSMTWSINLAIGSGIGGLIAWKFGREAVFVINAASFVLSAALLWAMKVDETHTRHLPPVRLRDFFDFKPTVEGFKYVRQEPRMWSTLLVKAGMGLLGAHWVILPVFGERLFVWRESGTLSMSLLFGARGVGALIGSLLSGHLARNQPDRMRRGIFWGFLIVAAGYMALGGADSLWTACLFVILGHTGTSLCWVYSTTMLHGMTEDRYRGRVFSADYAGLFLIMSVVSFAAAVMVDAGVSVRVVAFGTGVIGILPAMLWYAARGRYFGDGSRQVSKPASAQRTDSR
ncbi:MAG: MFS transporter [Bryobacteraceae bacterium]|nr:MFS transporter [Bryobacteraceae bacterium]